MQLPGGLLLPLADGRRAGRDGDAVTVGVRPEHLEPGTGLDLIIDLIEPLGSETLVHGRLAGTDDHRLTVKLGVSIAVGMAAAAVAGAATGAVVALVTARFRASLNGAGESTTTEISACRTSVHSVRSGAPVLATTAT